jgi:lipoprotein-anchoring transpeptidase ErfK/SrfK
MRGRSRRRRLRDEQSIDLRIYTDDVSGVRTIGLVLLAACSLLGFSAALALASSGESSAPAQTTEPPTTTETQPTTPTQPAPPPRQAVIPSGVTVGHVEVGDLTPYEAAAIIREEFAKPVALVGPGRRFEVSPDDVGAKPNIKKAIARARFSRPGANVPLHVWVSRERIRAIVDSVAGEVDRAPSSAEIVLRGARIEVKRSKPGRRLERLDASRAIRVKLKSNLRDPVQLEFAAVKPEVGESELGAAVVIMRGSNRLRLYRNAKLVRTFGVATGEPSYPTPVGAFEIVTMQRNPWWYPPPSDWAADSDPVPPGPGNPLGTRWMGISSPYVGIHGTPDAASIGYSASHGCIRMRISEAEWLFQRVKVGTPVFIVPS